MNKSALAMRDSLELVLLRPQTMEYKVSTNNNSSMDFESSENVARDVGFKSSNENYYETESLNINKSDKIKRWDKKRMLLDKYLNEVLRNVCPNMTPEPAAGLPNLGHRHYSVEHHDTSSKGARQKENFHQELLPLPPSGSEFDDRLNLNSPNFGNDCIPQLSSLNLESDALSTSCSLGQQYDVKTERFEPDFFSSSQYQQTLMNPSSYDYYSERHYTPEGGVYEEEMCDSREHQHYTPDDAYKTEFPLASCRDDTIFEPFDNENEPLDLSIPKEESPFHNMSFYNDSYDETNSLEFPSKEETDQQNSWLKKIKTGTRSRVRSPKSWEFLLRLLMDPKSNPSMIRWEDKSQGTFRLVQKDEIAKIWGMRSSKHKDGGLSYDNFARNLRYHYKTKMLVPVSEKHLVYKFSTEVMQKMYSLIN